MSVTYRKSAKKKASETVIVQDSCLDGHDAWMDDSDSMVVREEASSDGRSNLEERVAKFGEAIVRFAKQIPRGPGNDRLKDQLVGAGTSIGANYLEATECFTRKDFISTITRVVKEAKETKCFLRMVAAAEPPLAAEARIHYREAHELHMIFASMRRNKRN